MVCRGLVSLIVERQSCRKWRHVGGLGFWNEFQYVFLSLILEADDQKRLCNDSFRSLRQFGVLCASYYCYLPTFFTFFASMYDDFFFFGSDQLCFNLSF